MKSGSDGGSGGGGGNVPLTQVLKLFQRLELICSTFFLRRAFTTVGIEVLSFERLPTAQWRA